MTKTEQMKPATKSTNPPNPRPKAAVTAVEQPMTKRDRLRARLEQTDGASLVELATEFGWQPHTVRAAISGLRKAGLEVQRETVDTSSVYRILAAKAA